MTYSGTATRDPARIAAGRLAGDAAALNNLMLALLLPKRQLSMVPEAQTDYAGNREEALQLPLDSG